MPTFIVPMKTIFPGDNPETVAQRTPHPFYFANATDRASIVRYLQSLGTGSQ